METIERWLIRKTRLRATTRKQAIVERTDAAESDVTQGRSRRWNYCPPSDKTKIIPELTKDLHEHSSSDEIMFKLAYTVATGLEWATRSVYSLPFNDLQFLFDF